MGAGSGFKTFASGDILTASDVNGYLMQGVWVFADAAARTAAVTSPQEGNVSFLKDTNALEIYDGAAWVAYGSGDITGVTTGANSGLTGGATSGTADIKLNMAAKGDLIAGTGSGTSTVVTVGANNTVLTADSAATGGVKWATVSVIGNKPMTLLNAGGTDLTGAATITVSGISNQQALLIIVDGGSMATASTLLAIRFNGITTNNYRMIGIETGASSLATYNSTAGSFYLAQMGNNAAALVSGGLLIWGTNSSGLMPITANGMGTPGGGSGQLGYILHGYFDAAAAITSVSAFSHNGNFDAGKIYVYGMGL